MRAAASATAITLWPRRALDISGCRSRGDLWNLVDEAHLALLAEVLRCVIQSGALPDVQTPPEPVAPQYYRMHEELTFLLQRRLVGGARS